MLKMLIVLLLALASAGAGATTIGSGAGQVGAGESFTVNFNGIVEGTVVGGLTSQITFTVDSISSNTVALTYSITNTSSSPITASRVSGFGFNSAPGLAPNGAVLTGVFTREYYNANVPQLGTFEFCGNNNPGNGGACAGGGSAGVTLGNTNGGTLTLTFSSAIAGGAELTDYFVRYQSIGGTGLGNSGVGVAAPPVPEPGAMAVFGLGALIVGAALRKRDRQ